MILVAWLTSNNATSRRPFYSTMNARGERAATRLSTELIKTRN
jgi:hypothetical protein